MDVRNEIKVGDIVFHTLSSLYYICENKKHERWMNENHFYVRVHSNSVPPSYFKKNIK